MRNRSQNKMATAPEAPRTLRGIRTITVDFDALPADAVNAIDEQLRAHREGRVARERAFRKFLTEARGDFVAHAPMPSVPVDTRPAELGGVRDGDK